MRGCGEAAAAARALACVLKSRVPGGRFPGGAFHVPPSQEMRRETVDPLALRCSGSSSLAAAPPVCICSRKAANEGKGVPLPHSPRRQRYCRLWSSVAEVAEE